MSGIPRNHSSSVAPGGSVPPAGRVRVQESLVLLARDESLIEALGSIVPIGGLTVVTDETELVSQLLGGLAGVAFIDEGAIHGRAGNSAQLIQRLREQLPGTVLVVAGDGAAQNELAALVADGTIYRFVHKPVSAQRVKLFVDAAFRKREGNSASGIYPTLSLSQTAPVLTITPPRTPLPWRWILGGAALIIGVAATLAVRSMIAGHTGTARRVAAAVIARPAPQAPPVATPRPVTVAAAPAAPASPPADFDSLATAAEQALLAGNLNEASRLTEAARAVDPQHVRVKFLTTQIGRERARAGERRRTTEADAAPPRAADAPLPAAPAVNPPTAAAEAPVATSGPATASGPAIAAAPNMTSPPTSAPPVSEARDPNSVAAVVLQRISGVDPDYPDVARERGLTGYVDLEFLVRADGTVTDVTVLKAVPNSVFERSAVAAVRRWRYRPISRNGVPVSEHARIRLNFAYK